jgi:polysaccharide export outer membrane protein
MPNRFLSRQRCGLLLACATLALGGCASLPSSGPTAKDIVNRQGGHDGDFNFTIVNLDSKAVAELSQIDQHLEQSQISLASLAAEKRSDLIGSGDVLAINIYEVGVALFSGSNARTLGAAGMEPSAHSENFPAITVDSDGAIHLPYLGRMQVGGRSTADVEKMIDEGLKSKSQAPQALVAIRQNVANTAYVSGEVRKPGRIELSLAHEHLLDAIANAGGATNSPEDTVVRVYRSGAFVEQRLATIRPGSKDDLLLLPGDRIDLTKRPRTYIVFGATSHVSEVPFEKSGVTLAEALARVGGPTDYAADPTAALLFRYERDPATAAPEHAVVYRLNMEDPASYFLAQRVAMRDKDVIYIANAGANRPTKLVGIINQLFAPFVTARQLAP